VQKAYIVSKTDEVTGGGYVIQTGNDCETVLTDITKLVMDRYPRIRKMPGSGTPSCGAASIGMWKDPTSGSTIAISWDPYQGGLNVTYTAPDIFKAEIESKKAEYESAKKKDATRF
jgi:hypothetical protein